MSLYTRAWLRLLGIDVGHRAEVSVVDGLNRLTHVSSTGFMADGVLLASARARGGWMHVAGIEVGRGAFLGNSAIVAGGTQLGDGSLLGALSSAPAEVPAGTSWFGCPALELPQRCEPIDPARTVRPPRRLIVARGTIEIVRILLPATISLILGLVMFDVLQSIGSRYGIAAMVLATPLAFLAAGVCAAGLTIILKWLLIGRYRRGQHPLWSFFVWRDEIINTAQEQLSGPWLIRAAMGTPLMRVYLRLMGARVGRDVWCETMAITEFDMVRFDHGSVVNRNVAIDTHLYHDRLMRIGSTQLGGGATLGPGSAVLPDTKVGDRCSVGARSVVMRGEELPAGTGWHGAPVVTI